MLVFFTTLGLSIRFETILQGGKQFIILGAAAIVFMGLENGIGAVVAFAVGLDALVGVIGGTVSMAGGPGTATAWAPTFEKDYGIKAATEIGNAFAMAGMVLGGILGGPLAARLIAKYKLKCDSSDVPGIGLRYADKKVEINYHSMLRTILTICITVGIGLGLFRLLQMVGFKLPAFAA